MERPAVLIHELADLSEHPPCRLVGHAQLAFELLGADTAASRAHDVHGVKPRLERRGGLLKDGPGQRVDVRTAVVAGIGFPARDASMRTDNTALPTHDPVWVDHRKDGFQAGIFIREITIEVCYRVFGGLFHDCSIPDSVLAVKG